jgi:hypothetical protein
MELGMDAANCGKSLRVGLLRGRAADRQRHARRTHAAEPPPLLHARLEYAQVELGAVDALDAADVPPTVLGVVGVQALATEASHRIDHPVAVDAAAPTGGLTVDRHAPIVARQPGRRTRRSLLCLCAGAAQPVCAGEMQSVVDAGTGIPARTAAQEARQNG